MGFLPNATAAMPIYLGGILCMCFVACFFATTLFLGGILRELRRGAFRGYRVQLVKAKKDEIH